MSEKAISIQMCVEQQACHGIHSCISRDKCMRQISAEIEKKLLKKEK